MLTVNKIISIEEAKKYNQDLEKFRNNPAHFGCVSTRACENCGALVSDSICLCIGLFTCPNCNKDNAANVLDWRTTPWPSSTLRVNVQFYPPWLDSVLPLN